MRHTHCMLYVFNLQRYNFLLKLPHKKSVFCTNTSIFIFFRLFRHAWTLLATPQTAHLSHFVGHRLLCINPLNGKSTPFHTAKPRHLTFSKLMDGYFELPHHLVECQMAEYIVCNKLILKPIVQQIFGWNACGQ